MNDNVWLPMGEAAGVNGFMAAGKTAIWTNVSIIDLKLDDLHKIFIEVIKHFRFPFCCVCELEESYDL